ncbi:MAG: hypothetical protein FJ197_08830 [Gammaproteobacteria bacterium]|nr:hypothetical protein [Gammaproteobacteria bacterium]
MKTRSPDPGDEQLLKLFWNRAELKKELAQLRRDRDRLVEQLRQQEHTNLRSQQRLEQLEALLADPLEAANAVVYYQLRRVWLLCHRRLDRLARELADRQREREEQRTVALFERRRDGELARIDEDLAAVDRKLCVAEAEWQKVEQNVRRWRGFWNYFRRRAASERAVGLRADLDALVLMADGLRNERRQIEREPLPEWTGLSLDGRRNINFALIAMAQRLLIHFSERDIAVLAREAYSRGLAELSYGTVAECRDLSAGIADVLQRLDHSDRLSSQIRRRAEYLQRSSSYRSESDAVPGAAEFNSVPLRIADVGEPRPADENLLTVNVLVDDYWDLNAVLLN